MTPESIRVLSRLRSEFYSLFVATMNVPVKISGSSYNSVSFIASWIDDKAQLNYLNIYAYTAPDELLIERPFILRVAINKGAGSIVFSRQGQLCRGLNQRWQFELTVLPEEIMDFLPWVVSLIKAKAKGSLSFAQAPPHPLTSDVSDVFMTEKVWTRDAERTAELQHVIN
jgi:hypothetical protein